MTKCTMKKIMNWFFVIAVVLINIIIILQEIIPDIASKELMNALRNIII